MDDYKKLGKPEWGRKARKAISRSKKSTLKRATKEECECWDHYDVLGDIPTCRICYAELEFDE